MTKKYVKPVAQSLGALAAAEGACSAGGTAYGQTCSKGSTATGAGSVCGTGTSAASTAPAFCTGGASAANCLSGSVAGG